LAAKGVAGQGLVDWASSPRKIKKATKFIPRRQKKGAKPTRLGKENVKRKT